MSWRVNKEIPQSHELQEAVAVALALVAGTSAENPRSDGEFMGYASRERLAEMRPSTGTVGGVSGNVFSEEMVELLREAEQVWVCWYERDGRREVAAMAVRGFTAAQGDEMSRLAKEAGGCLRPDVANILGLPWLVFEGE